MSGVKTRNHMHRERACARRQTCELKSTPFPIPPRPVVNIAPLPPRFQVLVAVKNEAENERKVEWNESEQRARAFPEHQS